MFFYWNKFYTIWFFHKSFRQNISVLSALTSTSAYLIEIQFWLKNGLEMLALYILSNQLGFAKNFFQTTKRFRDYNDVGVSSQ